MFLCSWLKPGLVIVKLTWAPTMHRDPAPSYTLRHSECLLWCPFPSISLYFCVESVLEQTPGLEAIGYLPRNFLSLERSPKEQKKGVGVGSHTLTLWQEDAFGPQGSSNPSIAQPSMFQPQFIPHGRKWSRNFPSVRLYRIQGGKWVRLTGNQRLIGSVWVSGWWDKVNFCSVSAWKGMWGVESGGCEGRPQGQNDSSSGKALGCEVRQPQV